MPSRAAVRIPLGIATSRLAKSKQPNNDITQTASGRQDS